MKKLLILSLSMLLSACATASEEEVVTDPEVVTSQRVSYQDDGQNGRIYEEDIGYTQRYADPGRRRVRVIRTSPVETYQQASATVIEESYAPSYSNRPSRMIEEDVAPRRAYNRPRYAESRYSANYGAESTFSRPCRQRPTAVSEGYRTVSSGKGCPDEIRETREPVEILYKKTTYKTIYEPKTYTDVSYEKEPYRAGMIEEVRPSAPVSQPSQSSMLIETSTTRIMD